MAKIGVSSDTHLLLGWPPRARYAPILDRKIQVLKTIGVLFILEQRPRVGPTLKVSIGRLGVKKLPGKSVDPLLKCRKDTSHGAFRIHGKANHLPQKKGLLARDESISKFNRKSRAADSVARIGSFRSSTAKLILIKRRPV